MKTIETPAAIATILDERMVLIRAKSGVEINHRGAAEGDRLVSEAMAGDYGLIIDRREDYSVQPVEVFRILNQNKKLKAIAIVAHRPSTVQNAEIDRRLFRGKLAVFGDLDTARNWLNAALD